MTVAVTLVVEVDMVPTVDVDVVEAMLGGSMGDSVVYSAALLRAALVYFSAGR